MELEIGIPILSEEALQTLAEVAEEGARKHVYSRVPKKEVATLGITVETVGSKPVTVSVDVEVALSPTIGEFVP